MTPLTRLSRTQRTRAAAIASLGHPLIALLGSTCRWQVEGYEHYAALRASGRVPIFAFWHGRILGATYFWRNHGIVVMISENFDGEWIARIIRRFGYRTARGSTSRGGPRALAQLRRDIRDGRPAGFAVDGPRGPARSVQPGAVWLARRSGSPILPFHIEAERYWSARSWDRTQVPRPFSRVAVAIGKPLDVGPDADAAALEAGRAALEASLQRLSERAATMLTRR
ncbi:MAG: lysophospholipid acyltransferase family protein [Acidobacteria bacterium]|nr:lysophospholipid acyltransferase family protein [Acidobacteriota bacterium]